MPRYESDIQNQIVSAIKHFFTSPKFSFQIPDKNIRVIQPASGAQSRKVDDFSRKPYDVAVYAKSTLVIFLEIKERLSNGHIPEYRAGQADMLLTINQNRVNIDYAYNTWDFSHSNYNSPDQILVLTHVRKAEDMESPIEIIPIAPAQTLHDYLDSSISEETSSAFIKLLDSNIEHLNTLMTMPMMILANFENPDNFQLIIDMNPQVALKQMKKLFGLEKSQRQDWLEKNVDDPKLSTTAEAIFGMKDEWLKSKKLKFQ
jgi:hypothetical protein